MLFNRVLSGSKSQSRMDLVLLAFTWLAGFVSGMLFSMRPGSGSTLLRSTMITKVTIPGLLVVLVLPLFFSIIAVLFPKLLYFVCFQKALCFGCSSGLSLLLYSRAGWLIRLFVLFSDLLFQPCLFWLWVQHLDGNRVHLREHIFICISIIVIIGLLDYFLVSPYLVMLMDL